MAPRPSITGFDPKKLAAASANGTKGDPWAR
jgi:NADH dehydrogenase (ubiquinone) 1 beta subcomplex subunit 3